MTIDSTGFTPWSSFAGGLLIGLAAAIFLMPNGRIAGISGIVGGLLRPSKGDVGWRMCFILGLVSAAAIFVVTGHRPNIQIDASVPILIIAGLLVGAGTRYGSGCTSGHGVCGLSRLSMRSFVATISFMLAGFATVFVARHLLA